MEEQAKLLLDGVKKRMTEYYDQYTSDPSIVLPRHAFLFMA